MTAEYGGTVESGVWVPAPVGHGELLRFGPGVPGAAPVGIGDQAAAIWRGEAAGFDEASRRRAWVPWLLPLLVLIAVLAILLWQRTGSPITVGGATVRADAPSLTCDDTATITGTLRTNGERGTITYRWRRSDGTISGDLQQQVAKGTNQIDVVLLWAFHGQGTLQATATLEVISPSPASSSTSFAYSCK